MLILGSQKAADDARKAAIAEKLQKEREKEERLVAEEAELHAEYVRRHKRAEIEIKLKQEEEEAELAAKARAQEQDLRYKESLVEIDEKRGALELQKQQGLVDIEIRRTKGAAEESIRVLKEERRNITARTNEGYLAAEIYHSMQDAGFTRSRPALADVSSQGNKALEWKD